MRHIVFGESEQFPIAVLVKGTAFNQQEIQNNYVNPLSDQGIDRSKVIAFTLKYNEAGKAPAKFIKEYLDNLLPALVSLGTTHLYVTDATYFKVLTKETKAEPHFGYILPCKIKGFEQLQVVLGLNYQQLIYNPDLKDKLDMSIDTLASHFKGNYQALGSNIIHSESYPDTTESIAAALQSLHQYPSLTCDIETFSLRFEEAGIGTISFAWDKNNGIGFACDYAQVVLPDGSMDKEAPEETWAALHGYFKKNPTIRALLKQFFTEYQGKLTWHNAAFDVKVLVYTLWMKDLLDTEGLLEGLEIMTQHIDDTKIIAYLATNSTAGNVLGLKPLAHEFAGKWAVGDITDIRRIPLPNLLRYNLVDCLSTHYVLEKYYPILVQDKQEDLYHSLMLPSLKLIIQIELTGMPMDMAQVQEAKRILKEEEDKYLAVLQNSPIIKMFDLLVQKNAMDKANAKLKTKQHPLEKFADERFNPNSGPQLQRLLYEQMGLPVLDYTDTKQPATGGDTIEKLTHHTQQPEYLAILEALIGLAGVSKILTAFIPSFEKAILKGDGVHYLHGSFNLGGTVSGRLSSSKPNLQQIPANSTYGKLIKKCFKAAFGWLFAGADFNSLEDYISALTTKDPNKLIIYEQGMDSHAFRAMSYFKKQIPEYSLATESDRCFRVTDSQGKIHFIKCGTLVSCPNGETLPIEKWIERKTTYALEENKGLL